MRSFKIIQVIRRVLFPKNLDSIFSEESKERTALGVAARYARGNINVQNGRVTTQRKFEEEMNRLARRAGQPNLH